MVFIGTKNGHLQKEGDQNLDGRSGGIFRHRRTRLRRGTLGFTIPHDDADNGKWSERRDLNPRPFAPQANALPVCATPRKKRYEIRWGFC